MSEKIIDRGLELLIDIENPMRRFDYRQSLRWLCKYKENLISVIKMEFEELDKVIEDKLLYRIIINDPDLCKYLKEYSKILYHLKEYLSI